MRRKQAPFRGAKAIDSAPFADMGSRHIDHPNAVRCAGRLAGWVTRWKGPHEHLVPLDPAKPPNDEVRDLRTRDRAVTRLKPSRADLPRLSDSHAGETSSLIRRMRPGRRDTAADSDTRTAADQPAVASIPIDHRLVRHRTLTRSLQPINPREARRAVPFGT